MESIVLNLLVSVSGIVFSVAGTAWKIQRHFDERLDVIRMELMASTADGRVERAKSDGEIALLKSAIEGSIERCDEKAESLGRELRSVQLWLSKHYRYPIKEGGANGLD